MSRDISLTAPDMADNGASVQISCATSLPDAVKLMVLVEKNQHPLCAVFELTEQVEPNWVMRIKMAQSSWVWAVVVTRAGSVFFAQKDIRVTIGGCGE
jgi:sulfur-oxidizing protein SoxY